MLNEKQISEIKELLEQSQNPLFLFDNDVDGLCSFLVLRRALDRGRGVPIKTFPDLSVKYLRKVEELAADLVVILDKAEVSEEFVDAVNEKGIPILWIDHHLSESADKIKNKLNYFTSYPEGEPTTYIAQSVFNNKKDLWLALVGCIGDVYDAPFGKAVEKEYPELFNSQLNAFDALHSTEIGKIVRMLNFGLMDTTTNVVNLVKYLFTAESPYAILEENPRTRQLHKRYSELNDVYERQVKKAMSEIDKKDEVILFSYSGHISMSSEIANKLCYLNPGKIVIVCFKRPDKINASIRGKGALKLTQKVVAEVEGAIGGGHEEATGATVPVDKWEEFVGIVTGKD